MMDTEIKDVPESVENSEYLLGVIECQLQVIVTISEMDGALYDELTEDKIKTMSGAFRLIRESQRKILDDVRKMGKG